MEEVPGISGGIPPLVLYPDANVKASLPTAEWEACLDSWLFSLEYRLRLQDKEFSNFRLSQEASGVSFLLSFFRSSRGDNAASLRLQKEKVLFKRAYLLLRRLLLVTAAPLDYEVSKLLDLVCLACQKYASVADWKITLMQMWKRNQKQMTHAVEEWKKSTLKMLSTQSDSLLDKFRLLDAFLKVSADTGLVLMTGSDYLETLMEAFSRLQAVSGSNSLERVMTEHIFYCLRSLMSDGSSHGHLLLDHLFFMKSEAERTTRAKPNQPTLCSSLLCSTSFLRHFAADSSVTSSQRGQGLLDSLMAYRQNTRHLHGPAAPRRKKVTKGKGKADSNEEMHMHKASRISQVHDLFPNLPNHYILKLLDNFHDDTEAVVAALLEPDSLSADLRDHGSFEEPVPDINGPAHDLVPRSTPPPPSYRRNVLYGDEFDAKGRLHVGRKDAKLDQAETGDDHARRKAAIMFALAAFDSDDDERDDTYDVADVGGTVDATIDSDDRPRPERNLDQNPHEETLFRVWRDSPEIFSRDSKTRISKVRQELKRDTQMSDEQIEGWAIMLRKDPKVQERLEKKYAASQTFRGSQATVASTRWQGDNTPEDSEEGEGSGGRRMGQAQIRGNRTWGRGGRGGGSAAGPSGDAATQAARKRKEQGRGRGGAGHNRREGRAKKMGRGMAGGVQQ